MVVETKYTVNKNNEKTLSSTVITTGNIFTNENKGYAFFGAHRRYLFIATRDLSGALKCGNHTRLMKTAILHGIHLVYGITYHLQQRITIIVIYFVSLHRPETK